MVHERESEEASLGVVDAACTLAARAFGQERSSLGELAGKLKAEGPLGLDLARRLSRASKARRLRAHPDPLLLGDLEVFLSGLQALDARGCLGVPVWLSLVVGAVLLVAIYGGRFWRGGRGLRLRV